MALGTFTVAIDGDQLGAGTEKTAKIRVQFAGSGNDVRAFIKDTDADKFVFPHQTNPSRQPVSLPYNLVLKTDVTSGVSTEIGYYVTVTTAYGGVVSVGPFGARPAGSTIALVDLASDFEGQVAESIAVRAETAAAEAEAAKTAAEAVGNTNDTIMASRTNDGTSAFRGALNNVHTRGSMATVTVAAANSPRPGRADYQCDGTDDQVTINAAIAALPAGGGRVLLRAGEYVLSDEIVVRKQNVTIEGEAFGFWDDFTAAGPGLGEKGGGTEGFGATKLKQTNVGAHGIHLDNLTQDPRLHGITIRNLYIYGKTGTTYSAGSGIYCFDDDPANSRPSDQVVIERVFVHGFTTGMKLWLDAGHVVGNTIMDCAGDGLIFGGYFGLAADNVIADNGGVGIIVPPAATGLPILRNNTLVRLQRAVLLQGPAQVHGNNIWYTVSHGVQVDGAAHGSSVLNNHMVGLGAVGVFINGAARTRIIGNYVQGAVAESMYVNGNGVVVAQNNIKVESGASAIILQTCFGGAVTGNMIEKSGGSTVGGNGIAAFDSDRLSVTGNSIVQYANFGTAYNLGGLAGGTNYTTGNVA